MTGVLICIAFKLHFILSGADNRPTGHDLSWETCSSGESPELPENCATEESKAHFMNATKVIQAANQSDKQESDVAPLEVEEDSIAAAQSEDLDKTPVVETDNQEEVDDPDNSMETVIEIKPETPGNVFIQSDLLNLYL